MKTKEHNNRQNFNMCIGNLDTNKKRQKETWYLLYRCLGGPQSWSGKVWKISPPLGFDP